MASTSIGGVDTAPYIVITPPDDVQIPEFVGFQGSGWKDRRILSAFVFNIICLVVLSCACMGALYTRWAFRGHRKLKEWVLIMAIIGRVLTLSLILVCTIESESTGNAEHSAYFLAFEMQGKLVAELLVVLVLRTLLYPGLAQSDEIVTPKWHLGDHVVRDTLTTLLFLFGIPASYLESVEQVCVNPLYVSSAWMTYFLPDPWFGPSGWHHESFLALSFFGHGYNVVYFLLSIVFLLEWTSDSVSIAKTDIVLKRIVLTVLFLRTLSTMITSFYNTLTTYYDLDNVLVTTIITDLTDMALYVTLVFCAIRAKLHGTKYVAYSTTQHCASPSCEARLHELDNKEILRKELDAFDTAVYMQYRATSYDPTSPPMAPLSELPSSIRSTSRNGDRPIPLGPSPLRNCTTVPAANTNTNEINVISRKSIHSRHSSLEKELPSPPAISKPPEMQPMTAHHPHLQRRRHGITKGKMYRCSYLCPCQVLLRRQQDGAGNLPAGRAELPGSSVRGRWNRPKRRKRNLDL